MKAIIPVAGAGTQLRPLTYTQPKPLIPVAGKPIISFIIDQLTEVGIDDFVFVLGYLGEKIKAYLDAEYPNIKKTYVQQEQRLGSAHALWIAREALREAEELMVFFGDTIVEVDFKEIIASEHSCVGVKRVDDPREFGVVAYNEHGLVSSAVEKPKIPKSNMAMVGFYYIKEVPQLLSALDTLIGSENQTQGEYHLTDALQKMIDQGVQFSTKNVDNWYDCGQKSVLLETNAILLKKMGYATDDLPVFENSILIHPVSIGANCEINHSIIGPNVTIGNHAKIESAIVRNSIIGNYAALREVVLRKSVIGNDTSISGLRQSLNIGDNTEIDFSGNE